MRVKVITRFRDRHTRELHKKGVYLDITPERYEEIMGVGAFVSVVEDDTRDLSTDTEKPLEEAPAPSGDDLEGMTVKELREYAENECKLTLPRGLKKAEIIEAIRRTSK